MRMSGPVRIGRRIHHEERGAVLMIVAVSFIALMATLALTVDLGRVVATKREMVRAADAAALAAAQQCAFGNGSAAAQAEAIAVANANRAGSSLVSISIDPECDAPTSTDPRFVTVEFESSVDMFVAPIFGVDTTSVSAEATAIWAASGPIPISVNVVPLDDCRTRDPEPTEDEPCVIEYPKEDLENPRWGILDLRVWGDGNVSSCPVPNSQVVDIIDQGGWGSVLKPPPPAWDCIDNGAQFASWMALEGKTVWFPVIDIPASKGTIVPGNEGPCFGSEIPDLQARGKDCRLTTAWVLEFVKMEVLKVYKIGSTHVLETVIKRSVPSSTPGIEVRLVD